MAEVSHRAGARDARIEQPVDLRWRGVRVWRRRRADLLLDVTGDATQAYAACCAACESMDLSLEGMSAAYVSGYERSARSDATYRLFSLMRNVSTERERQRAMLLDWENTLLYAIASDGNITSIHPLAGTEFGRWFTHKGAPSFADQVTVNGVQQAISRIDDTLKQLSTENIGRMTALEAIRLQLGTIRKALSTLFEQASELDSGTDSLTTLLNRRFLPSVLRREILLADRSGEHFSILMLDIDHFKTINDRFGHAAGDAVLKHVADLLGQQTRGSDYLFRMGGEEFLVVLIDCDEDRASSAANLLCSTLAHTPMDWAGAPQGITVTASIGVAVYDGHPDYEHLLKRADTAMYLAKQSGRNQVRVSHNRPSAA